jgi:serine/threonine-protein kinase
VGVIHRDIKPQNLFITQQRVVKLMDFGIAKLEAAARLTSPGMGVGTPEYMAPEQILDSSKVSAATDLYAIGVTAYRMCTGRVPFSDKDLLKLFKKQLKEEPPAPRSINPRLPPQLEAILLKLLQKDPAARYRRAAEVADAFAAVRKLFPGSPTG